MRQLLSKLDYKDNTNEGTLGQYRMDNCLPWSSIISICLSCGCCECYNCIYAVYTYEQI